MTMNSFGLRKLGDVCDKITVGHVGKTRTSYIEDGIPFLRSQNVKPFGIEYTNLKTIRPSLHKRLRKSELLPGDVVVVRTGNPGTAAVIPKNLRFANCADLVVIRPGKLLDPWFLAVIFNTHFGQSRVASNLVGAAEQYFNVSAAKAMKIPFPELKQQEIIGKVARLFTTQIENNSRRIVILEEMAQAIYRQWFINFRFPGHENIKFVDSSLGQIPAKWDVGSIGSCSTVIPGYAFKSKDWQETGVKVVKIKNITDDNCVDLSTADCVPEELITSKLSKFMLRSGDILIAMTGATAGKVGVLRAREPTALNQRVAKIVPKSRFRFYLLCFLVTNRELLFNLADGAAQPNMSGGQIESVPLVVPPSDLMYRFDSWVSDLTRLVDTLYFKNMALRKARDMILPKLISGKLDVEDLDIDTSELAKDMEDATI